MKNQLLYLIFLAAFTLNNQSLFAADQAGAGPSSQRKVPLVLLAEKHSDVACSIANSQAISGILMPGGRQVAPDSFLLISEGRHINPSYQALRLPPRNIICELGEQQNKTEMLNKFFLAQELLTGICLGADPREIHPTLEINAKWFVERMNNDGFAGIIEGLAEGKRIYCTMALAALARNVDKFLAEEHKLLEFMRDVSLKDHDELKTIVENYVAAADKNAYLKGVFAELARQRDIAVTRKIEATVQSNPKIKVAIMIFGQIHFDSLRQLISDSEHLSFDDAVSRKSIDVF